MAEKQKKKKNLTELSSAFLKEEHYRIEAAIRQFCPDGTVPQTTIYSTDPDAPKKILSQMGLQSTQEPAPKQETPLAEPSQRSLNEQFQAVQSKVLAGDSGQVLVALDFGKLLVDNRNYALENVIIKACSPDGTSAPVYIFFKKGGLLKVRVCLSNECSFGALVLTDSENREVFIRLSEFHLLSFRKREEHQTEVGLMVSYTVPTGYSFSVIMGWNLDPIRNLLMAEWFTKEWEKAKQGNMPAVSTLGLEGDRHGQEA